MTKQEIIDNVATGLDLSKAAVERVINSVSDEVKTALKRRDTVTFVGFGAVALLINNPEFS